MKQRSIPPANRSPRRRLSSMEAATRSGLIFVGVGLGSARQPRQSGEDSQFTPRVVKADPKVAEARREHRGAVRALAKRFKGLMDDAKDKAERQFWQDALERIWQDTLEELDAQDDEVE